MCSNLRTLPRLTLATAGLLAVGCGPGPRAPWTRGQADALVRQALEAPLPDARRRAIERLTPSPFAADDITIAAMDAIARTDDSPAVRRAAARCLGASAAPAALPALLAVLEGPADDGEDGRALAAALDAVEALMDAGVPVDQPPALIDAVAGLLRTHRDREVRVRAARLLGRLPQRQAVEALVDSMQQGEFAVSFQAEASLRQLTAAEPGTGYAAWRGWLERVGDPLDGRAAAAHGDPEVAGTDARPGSWWSRLFE